MLRGKLLAVWAPTLLVILACTLIPGHDPTDALAQQAEVTLYQESFDNGSAPHWQLEPGWRPADGALLGEGHQWARLANGLWRGYRVQARVKLLRGRLHLNYRFLGSSRYFVGFEEQSVSLSKQIGEGVFKDNLARGTSPFALGTWHQVEVAEQGGRLQVRVDGKLEIDYADPDPYSVGGLAFETLDSSAAFVDDVVVYGPPPDPRFTWVSMGGPPGGTGYDIRMRPDNPDTMFVTDAMAGIFISSDGGQNWSPSNDGISTRAGETGDVVPAFCVTIDPHDPNIVWLGMQNTRGVYKSVDGGRRWEEKVNGILEKNGITFRGFTVAPRSSQIVYAAAEISSWEWAGEQRNGVSLDLTKGVVYRTTDGGEHWSAIWRGDSLARYVWVDPRDSDVVYISTGIFDREAANSNPVAGDPGGEGILKTTDGGQTWSRMSVGLGSLHIGSLFMHPTNPDILLAGVGADIGTDNLRWSPQDNPFMKESGVYLSTDGGTSWRRTLRSFEAITSVEFSQTDPTVAYAGSLHRFYRSEDGGESWIHVAGDGDERWGTEGFRSGRPIDLQLDPRDPNRIFSNSYNGGNFVSVDGGRSWDGASRGYTGAQVRDVAVDPEDGGRVFAAARSGLFVAQGGGSDWSGLNFPPEVSEEWSFIAIDPSDRHHLLASTNAGAAGDGPLVESRDGGRSWRPVLARPNPQSGWRILAFAPSNPSVVYVGSGGNVSPARFGNERPGAGVYLSRDGGSSWRPAHGGVCADAHVVGLSVHPQDPETAFAATTNHGILRTTDGGQSWTEISSGQLRGRPALSVAVHPEDQRILYAGVDRGGVYRSDDGGQSWHPLYAGLNPEASVSDIVFDPANPAAMYLADRRSGVYSTTDGGATWKIINEGLRNREVNALAISSDGKHLYAATEGGGVFRLDLDGQAS